MSELTASIFTVRTAPGQVVAIYVKHNLAAQVIFSKSAGKQFETLALKIDLSGGQFLTVVGCYRQQATQYPR